VRFESVVAEPLVAMSDTISDWVEQTLATLNPEEIPRFRGRLDWYVPMARRFISRWTKVDCACVDDPAVLADAVERLGALCDALELTLETLGALELSEQRQVGTQKALAAGLEARSTIVNWWRFTFGRIALPGSKERDGYRRRDSKGVAFDLHELVAAIPYAMQKANKPVTSHLEAVLSEAARAADGLDRQREAAQRAAQEQELVKDRRDRLAALFHEELRKVSRGALFLLSHLPEQGGYYRIQKPPRRVPVVGE